MTSYKQQRFILIGLSLISIATAATLFLYFFRSNLVYFYGPSELPVDLNPRQIIRIGGLVEKGSLQTVTSNFKTTFWVTDNLKRLQVDYQGALPDLFREGQGVVAEGSLGTDGIFHARQILAKHDENMLQRL